MGNVNELLNERMKKSKASSKMTALAKQSAEGGRTGFTGIFGAVELSPYEKETIESILNEYSLNETDSQEDLKKLVTLSSEVKAINHQAALLHGERIKKAQEILKKYQEGAFTAWLLTTYGNRQTPYNFLQFYDFFNALPKALHPQIELMPRQAIYTLATREGDFKKKQILVEKYNGETKEELLEMIRENFPLKLGDRRKKSQGEKIISELKSLWGSIARYKSTITKKQKTAIQDMISMIQDILEKNNRNLES